MAVSPNQTPKNNQNAKELQPSIMPINLQDKYGALMEKLLRS
jgi:hypothetical protein